MITPELQNRIAQWRAKQVAGTLTLEDQKEAIIVLREWRKTAATAATESKARSKKAPSKSVDDLFDELGTV